MPSEATSGFNSRFYIDSADPANLIAEQIDATGPAFDMSVIDVTNKSTSRDATYGTVFREKRASINDLGTTQITCNLIQNNTGFQELYARYCWQTETTFVLVMDDGEAEEQSITFTGYIKSLPLSLPLDGPKRITMTIENTGVPAFSWATPEP